MYTANINIKNKLVNFGSFIEKLYKALIRKEIITLVFFFTTTIFVEMNVLKESQFQMLRGEPSKNPRKAPEVHDVEKYKAHEC